MVQVRTRRIYRQGSPPPGSARQEEPSLFTRHDPRSLTVHEEILVERSVVDTFGFVTDIENSEKISEHVVDVEPVTQPPSIDGAAYRRQLRIHGQTIEQQVQVERSDEKDDLSYCARTKLYGFDIVYTYRFTPIGDSRTRISLSKEASVRGIWRILTPLIRHLLTRPEHDGHHLSTLKRAVEAQ